MIKNIYILWFQGFKNAPGLVKKCLSSWKKYNPDWNIIKLNNNNLSNYINFDEVYKNTKDKHIPFAARSDMIRIYLLKTYGGVWADSTTFCKRPLNDWLEENIKEGFFGFTFKEEIHHKNIKRRLSSWFLYSDIDNYITSHWLERVKLYWINHNKFHHYYWFHGFLFNDIYTTDEKFKEIWDKVPIINASRLFLHSVQHNLVTPKVKNRIDDINLP
jgi:hypothetical protein